MNKYLKTPMAMLPLALAYGCSGPAPHDSPTAQTAITTDTTAKPNIIFVYMDDLGYGDVSAQGAKTISTPNFDRLANGGVRFTQGYATSATCSPSRYALLTGRYPWRNQRAKILPGNAAMLIDTTENTIPSMLKTVGYTTGIIGKWHLGLGNGNINWNQKIKPSPNDVGFDYSNILAATQDRVPTVYIENGHVVNLEPNDPIEVDYQNNFEGQPTGKDNPELLTMKWHHGHNCSIVNGIPRIGYMKGGKNALWSDIDMADHFINKVKNFITERKDTSFFLYYAMQQPHVPRTPHTRFVGQSGMGPRGDAILEADWCVGELLKHLEKHNLLENTLIVFSSDNGPVLNDGYYDDAVEKIGDHKPCGPLRGGKYSLFDAGTHVPFFTYWKGTITPAVSDALVCQVDLFNSLAALTGASITGPDSQNLLDAFLGNTQKGRQTLVLEANQKTALRHGDFVLIPPYGGSPMAPNVNIETGCNTAYQLYNLTQDVGQQNNLAKTNPEKLEELKTKYNQIMNE